MNKKRVADIYRFLASASMKRMNDDEKIALIRLLRTLKPVFTEMQDAVNDAVEKARAELEDESHIMAFVDKAVADVASETCDVETKTMTQETFERLCLSNDWNYLQIDELETILVK